MNVPRIFTMGDVLLLEISAFAFDCWDFSVTAFFFAAAKENFFFGIASFLVDSVDATSVSMIV